MEINKINTLSKSDKNMNFSLDSSRTADSVSNLYNSDTTPLKAEMDIDEIKNLEITSSLNYEDNIVDVKINGQKNQINDEKKNNKHQYFMFKMQISIIFSGIYLLLFLLSLPKTAVKVGDEKNLKLLIKTNNTQNIKILINNFQFFFDDENENKNHFDNNSNINGTEKLNKKKNNNYEFSGYILNFKVDNRHVMRWIIGFICFIIRCACFTFSEEDIKVKFLNKNRISFIQKLSCLVFPLWVFYYDINNNETYTKIKDEFINNKEISYYIMTKKQYSMHDYVEGIIPTLFYFLMSIVYRGMEEYFAGYFRYKKKMRKLT
jgi:hypothetical protein